MPISFKDLRQRLNESKNPPSTINLRRTTMKAMPNGETIAIYHASNLDRDFLIPFDRKGEAGMPVSEAQEMSNAAAVFAGADKGDTLPEDDEPYTGGVAKLSDWPKYVSNSLTGNPKIVPMPKPIMKVEDNPGPDSIPPPYYDGAGKEDNPEPTAFESWDQVGKERKPANGPQVLHRPNIVQKWAAQDFNTPNTLMSRQKNSHTNQDNNNPNSKSISIKNTTSIPKKIKITRVEGIDDPDISNRTGTRR